MSKGSCSYVLHLITEQLQANNRCSSAGFWENYSRSYLCNDRHHQCFPKNSVLFHYLITLKSPCTERWRWTFPCILKPITFACGYSSLALPHTSRRERQPVTWQNMYMYIYIYIYILLPNDQRFIKLTTYLFTFSSSLEMKVPET